MSEALVFGAGRSGRAAEALLRSQGFGVRMLEGRDPFPCGDRNVAPRIAPPSGLPSAGGYAPAGGATEVGAQPSATAEGRAFLSPRAEGVDFAVVSPGIPLAHPWVAEAKRRGIPLKSELQLGCEELRRKGWKLLAVTGSKGKSSVVKVVADAINLSGRQAVACGNYGLPVCEVALACGDRNVAAPCCEDGACGDKNVAAPCLADGQHGAATVLSPQERWAVVEVSSFMMETTTLAPDTFEAAAILNLQEDHLDRHGTVAVYHGLKRKLLSMAKRGLEPAATGMSPPHAELSPPGAVETGDGVDACREVEGLWAGSYFDNAILAGNAAIAVGLMRVAGLDDAHIAKAFREFVPLPHRMNLIAEIEGVRYIDDSKATSLSALVAGVKMAVPDNRTIPQSNNRTIPQSNNRTILLVAGGLPKGDDPKAALPTLTERVKKVYLIGQSAEAFSAAWKNAVDCEICGTMERAVERAMRDAEKGETVLLSPGTASFDQFKSFGERGEVFARLVKRER